MSSGKNRNWCWILVAALAGAAVLAVAEYLEIKSRVKALWMADVTVLVTTSDNNTNLHTSFAQIAEEDSAGLPKLSVRQDSPRELRLLVASDRPFNFEVGAEGYASKPVTIDGGGVKEMTLKLDRK